MRYKVEIRRGLEATPVRAVSMNLSDTCIAALTKSMEVIDKKLLAKAGASARLRQNLDLRTSGADGSQRMLNALLPGTRVPIHRHPESTENVLLLQGKLAEIFL